MSVTEIPLDAENSENNTENNVENIKNDTEIIQENDKNTEKNLPITFDRKTNESDGLNGAEENPPPEEKTEDLPPAPKRPRGRPKGTAKPKEAAVPYKPPKEPKNPKPKQPKPKKRVKYESSSSEEELPAYVREEVAPQRDLATQMLKLLQNHESIRSARKKQLYASWFAHH